MELLNLSSLGETVELSMDACLHRWSLRAHHAPPAWRRRATFAAFLGFGLASWVMSNAAYIELGVFLRVLPEKYGIFAYSIFALQSANIYPFLYILFNAKQQRVSHSAAIWFLLAVGVVGALLMSVLWRHTAMVFGATHSVAMLLLTHLGGLVSATSTVVFYPYVATFPPLYTSALSTGEGLSGSIVALLGIIQRPYDEESMRFSVEVFYVLCALIMVVSVLSFAFLELHPWSRGVKAGGVHDDPSGDIELQEHATQEPTLRASLAPVWPYLLCQLMLAAFSFGVLPSIMPYIYKKYAPVDDREAATARYQTLASVSSLILDPVARLLTSWVQVYRVREFTVVLSIVAVSLLTASLQSQPLASTTTHGFVLPLLAHVGFLVLYAYTQTMVFLTLKRISVLAPDVVLAHRVYQWSGFATQIGAFVGTIIIFPIVLLHEELFLTTAT